MARTNIKLKTEKDWKKLEKTMLKNIKTDKGMERNNMLMEILEEKFHTNLTTYYGEEEPRRIKRLMSRLKKK